MSEPSRQLSTPPTALVRHPDGRRWWHFPTLREVLRADSLDAVPAVLETAEEAAAKGEWAVGFCAYEAGPAFDPALRTHEETHGLPLAWFALCDPPQAIDTADLPPAAPFSLEDLAPTLGAEAHRDGVERIRRWIARGDTYQVNYTHHLEGRLVGSCWGLFRALDRGQHSPYAAWLDTGELVVCSTSPELFFEVEGDRLTTRTMKGTAPRGRTTAEDQARAAELEGSAKDRAENVMIVDMIRNDLGRVALPGTVETTRLFEVERYGTVFQMTSTIQARSEASFGQIFAALFPCASITGAPKVRTSRLIRELEPSPRGLYTGALGWMAPGRRARFSVAIRTLTVDRTGGRLRYGTGGGVVWDSRPEAEYAECRDKALILTAPRPEFQLLETLRWEPRRGFTLLDRHLERLADSARYFDFTLPPRATLRRRLRGAAEAWSTPRRVRLTLSRQGRLDLEAEALPDPKQALPRVSLALANNPVDSSDPFLFHKTTHREVYDRALREQPEADDVLLWNERGELTESTIANVVLELDGERFTPPIDSGLLSGTLRAEMLASGSIRERVLTLEDLDGCDAIYLINSVRGRRRAELSPRTRPAPGPGNPLIRAPRRESI